MPTISHAYYSDLSDIGSPLNPINVEVNVKPSNSMIEQQLKNTYGLSNYYECRRKCSYTSTPWGEKSCLLQIQYCLESKAMRESYAQQWDEDCKRLYGPYSQLGNIDYTNKKYNCECMAGYEMIEGVCARKPQLSPDEVCKRDYGPYSYYLNTDSSGKYVCSCQPGYEWQNNICVLKTLACPNRHSNPEVKNFVNISGSCVSPEVACTLVYGQNSERRFDPDVKCLNYEGYDTQGFVECCGCKSGYEWNNSETECVPILVNQNEVKEKVVEVKSVETKNNSVNNNSRIEPAVPTPQPAVTTSSTTNDEISDNPQEQENSAPAEAKGETKKEEANASKEGIFKPIRTFFGRILSRLASWLLK